MDWTMLGALGEIVGAGAVVATLLYLSLQIRTTNRISKAEAWRAFADKASDNAMVGAFDADFRAAFHKVLIERCTRGDLTEDERMMIGLWFGAVLNSFEQVYREVELGVLPAEALRGFGDQVYRTPYFGESWPLYLRNNHSGGFQAYMDREYALEPPALVADRSVLPPTE